MTPESPFSVYCVAGCDICTTLEYRVRQKQEQLAAVGVSCTISGAAGLPAFDREAFRACDVLLLYRTAGDVQIDELIRDARSRGVPVIFDIDDLVFEPDLAFQVDALQAMAPEDVLRYYQSVWLLRATLLASDYVLTSTEALAARVLALGKPARVHPNGLSPWMLEASAALVAQRRAKGDGEPIVIGYGSGTPTHRKDLVEVGGALARLMASHPRVELHIVGPLHLEPAQALPASLRSFESRIKRLPLTSWQGWLSTLSTFDINLAPLESGIPFSEAKSAIKFTEAAIVGVPTVASRTAEFSAAIREGQTGFLAEGADSWYAPLEQLVRDATLRRRIGDAARTDVLARYAPDVLGRQLVQTLQALRQAHAARLTAAEAVVARAPRGPLVLNWILPEAIPGSGGCMNAVRILNLLASFGHRINVYIVPLPGSSLPPMSDCEVRAHFARHFAPINGTVCKWDGQALAPSDAIFLTLWSTAYRIQGFEKTTGKIVYFVQDWEPFFYAMGEEYVRAEQTYRMGFACVTLGPWLTERLRAKYDADADYFDFAVDRSIYYPRPVPTGTMPRVCFYARPSTPRRLYALGIQALTLLHRQRPDVEIVLFGCPDRDLKAAAITFPYKNLGILNEQQLAELFSSAKVGLVLSSTNCSLLPPEMMACKCAVVDLNLETVRGVLEHEGNALLAEPTPTSIANAMLRLLSDELLRQRLVAQAFEQVQRRSWEQSARKIEEIVYRKLPADWCGARVERSPKMANPPAKEALPAHQQACLAAVDQARRRLPAGRGSGQRGWRQRVAGWEQRTLYGNNLAQTIGELISGRRVEQSFVAHHAGLQRVEVLVSTYGRINTGDVVLQIKDGAGGGALVAEVRVNASLIADNSYVSFCFPPQAQSRGKAYTVVLEAPDAATGDAITLWIHPRATLPDTQLCLDGKPGAGHLIFGLSYRDSEGGEFGERPLPQAWENRSTAFGLLVAPARALWSEGWRAMCRAWVALGRRAVAVVCGALRGWASRRGARGMTVRECG